jgi:hypothetical protein
MTFMDDVISGRAQVDAIDEYRDMWDADLDPNSPASLHEYLGLLWPEYAMWVEDHNVLPYVIGARQENVPLPDYLDSLPSDDSAVKHFRMLCRRYSAEWDAIIDPDQP